MAQSIKLKMLKDRAEQRNASRAETRRELALHAIEALSHLGYARTGMRDIAQQSGRSVGSLTYYFDDKADLICHCVKLYKQQFVLNIDAAIAPGKGDLIARLAQAFSDAVSVDAEKHRLWYDIRNQALFEEQFRKVVCEIEANLMALIARALERIGVHAAHTTAVYFMLDGAFRTALQAHANQSKTAAMDLNVAVTTILTALKSA